MKVTGTWEVPLADYKRFNVVSRDQNSLVLEDIERGRRHKIILESTQDFTDALTRTDAEWWNFLFLTKQF